MSQLKAEDTSLSASSSVSRSPSKCKTHTNGKRVVEIVAMLLFDRSKYARLGMFISRKPKGTSPQTCRRTTFPTKREYVQKKKPFCTGYDKLELVNENSVSIAFVYAPK